MKKAHVMQITHDLAIGGLQQVVVNICRTIDRNIFDISVLCLRNLGEFAPEVEGLGLKVFCLPQKQNGTDYFSFLKVAKILREEKVDIIHTHNTQPFIDGTIGALLSGVKTIVHTDHARDFPDKRRYMFAEWLMSHFAYKIVGVSDHTSHNLIKYEKISPRKIITIMNGIDGSKYNITIDKNTLKRKFGITVDGPIIGTIGRLVEEKGITYLLKAMKIILVTFPDAKLFIVGEGKLENNLKSEAFHLGISDNVIFTGNRRDIPMLLKYFDVFVLSSISEGLPMVLLEAMVASCPIVATNVGGTPMVITHGVNGSLVRPKDSACLSSEIINLLSNEKLRKQYIKSSYTIFNEKFSASTMTRKYEELYLKKLKALKWDIL